MENPISSRLQANLSELDFAVLQHGFAPHGRDYVFLIQDGLGSHKLTLTHVVHFRYETRVGDAVWLRSWSDEFLDYEVWRSAGEPDGYVWGTDWSLAYPGITLPNASKEADEWSIRLDRPMHPFVIETDRFWIEAVFSDAHISKQSGDTSPIQRVLIPIGKPTKT